MATTPTQADGYERVEPTEDRLVDTGSWHYWAVFRAPAHRFFLGVATVALVIALYGVMAVLNPGLPFSPRLIAIDHLKDPSPVHTYSKGNLTAIALSSNYVALGTEQAGLVLLPTHGVFPRRRFTKNSILDAAGGLDPDNFLALEKNQGLTSIDGAPAFPERRVLLDAPAHPVWPGMARFDPKAVMLAKLDQRGLLLVVEGAVPGLLRSAADESGLVDKLFARNHQAAGLHRDGSPDHSKWQWVWGDAAHLKFRYLY